MRVCLCVRADAGDSEGFLEDGLAGKLSLNRHGYQFGRGGQGEFIIRDKKCVYVILLNRPNICRGRKVRTHLLKVSNVF